jgi:VanZ family protein
VREFFLKHRWRIFLFLLFPWFFIGGPGYEGSRVFKEVWNLGHIMFFAVLALETFSYLTARHLASRTKYIFIMLLVLVLAASIEICQSLLPERVASFQDIILGLAGGLAVLTWKAADKQTLNRKIILRAVGMSGIVTCMIPLLFVVIDEYRAWRDFPVLSDFESFLDVSRWSGKGRVSRVRDPVKNGRYALMVPLNTDKYSGVALQHFPENWSNAQVLTFSVYNPGELVTLHYRIHDRKHKGKHQDYSDRFNKHTDLTSGWNTITVRMEEIENGPENRKMNIGHIRGFGLFVVEQPAARVLYIDYVKLF